MNPFSMTSEETSKDPFSAAEIELIVRSLAAECGDSGRWNDALSAVAKCLERSSIDRDEAAGILSVLTAQAAGRGELAAEKSLPAVDSRRLLRQARTLIDLEHIDQAKSILLKALEDKNRIDPLAARAEMMALVAAICLRKGEIGLGLDLFAQHLPGDLVALSRDAGPAAAVMQAELLCSAGERYSACEIAARLKLLWPHDPLVSRLLGKVLDPEPPRLPAIPNITTEASVQP